jgi:hypothetical protein
MRSGHGIELVLTADYPGGQSITEFLLVAGKVNFLVWDPTGDQSSGPVIFSMLESLGYQGHYRQAIDFVDLEDYATVFISLGINADTYMIPYESPEAMLIVNYFDAGGCIYLEGGDVWSFDPENGGYNFGPHFKISPTADGSPDLRDIIGQNESIAAGMRFDYVGENDYIDRINRIGAGVTLFKNSYPNYTCGVSFDALTYKTIGVSFEFAGLEDADPPSTKLDWARAIMDFFLPGTVQDVPGDGAEIAHGYWLSPLAPNPFSEQATFRYALPAPGAVEIALFDVSGRNLRTLVEALQPAGTYAVKLSRGDLKPGVYFIRSKVGGVTLARKCTVVR